VLVPPAWIRGAKVLAAMASGAWLLSDTYLSASSKAHRLLEEVSHRSWGLTNLTYLMQTQHFTAPVGGRGVPMRTRLIAVLAYLCVCKAELHSFPWYARLVLSR